MWVERDFCTGAKVVAGWAEEQQQQALKEQ
jgi:hypothetical protein